MLFRIILVKYQVIKYTISNFLIILIDFNPDRFGKELEL